MLRNQSHHSTMTFAQAKFNTRSIKLSCFARAISLPSMEMIITAAMLLSQQTIAMDVPITLSPSSTNIDPGINAAMDEGKMKENVSNNNYDDANNYTREYVIDEKSSTPGGSSNSNANNRKKINEQNVNNTHNQNNTTTSFSNQNSYANYDDEQTYLDLFGERAKEIITQHIIPSTDAECRWDWRMGRCEPYCECGVKFLWGDYHIGRSCRRRQLPHLEDGSAEGMGETSWEDAWQEMTERMDSPIFFSSLFSDNADVDDDNYAGQTVPDKTCTLPPESRYIQLIHHLTKGISHSTIILKQFQKFQHATIKMMLIAKTRGEHHFTKTRENACQTVKRKIEEREKERKQPVVLTRRGMIWIRRLCGAGGSDDGIGSDNGVVDGDRIEESHEMGDTGDSAVEE